MHDGLKWIISEYLRWLIILSGGEEGEKKRLEKRIFPCAVCTFAAEERVTGHYCKDEIDVNLWTKNAPNVFILKDKG